MLVHIGLCCSSEENADRFYRDVLDLPKLSDKNVDADLSYRIFGIREDLRLLNYANDDLHFEIFIPPKGGYDAAAAGRIDHTCLKVKDLPAFLDRCRQAGVAINQIPRQGPPLVFIRDFDGNLFEIKASP